MLELLTRVLMLRCEPQAVPVCLLLAGGASVAAALQRLVCWCIFWAALLASGSTMWARRVGVDDADWIGGTYGFMLVR